MEIRLSEVVGKGYKEFWNNQSFYRVVKGSRGSKKSKTIALNMITRIMQYPESNLVVLRRVFNNLKQSCRADLIWAIDRLGVRDLWNIPKAEHTLTYKPTGQVIIFRGFDDPLKLTSLTVEKGHLCWAWVEEAFQIENVDMFNTFEEGIRGKLPEHLFSQITVSFNPWSETHWLREKFYGGTYDKTYEDELTYAITTNYMINEFLDEQYLYRMQQMKEKNPTRYKVAGLGDWGITEGLVFTNWQEIKTVNINELIQQGFKRIIGLDFGFEHDPTALAVAYINEEKKELYIVDEHYSNKMLVNDIKNVIEMKGYLKEKIKADSSWGIVVEELRKAGLSRIEKARKGKNSILPGVQYLQQYDIYILSSCQNAITEFKNYSWMKDKTGKAINKPIDAFNHFIDALRYGAEELQDGGGLWDIL